MLILNLVVLIIKEIKEVQIYLDKCSFMMLTAARTLLKTTFTTKLIFYQVIVVRNICVSFVH